MKIFIILSHSESEALLKEVINFSNVIAMYIFDHRERIPIIMNNSTTKLHGKYSDLESLLIQLLLDYRNLPHASSLPISIFDREQNQKTVRDLNKESARFLWLQLLIDILLRTPCDEQSKNEILDECRTFYMNDASELKKIDEFAKIYESTEALKFYTNDSFFYRLLNQAFRTENIDFMFLFRFFLIDIYIHLQKLYSEQFLSNKNHVGKKLVVYRWQMMKREEFTHIKNNVGRIISINTYFSTTKNYDLAFIYSGGSSHTGESEFLSVIFEIEVDLTHNMTKRPFASLQDFSQFPEEEEILFSVGSIFRIVDVQDRRVDHGHWLVKMIIAEDDNDLNELRSKLDEQYSSYGNLCDFGYALIGMCDYDRAERYFDMLLERTSESSSSYGIIIGCFGVIFENRGDYKKALEFQQIALKFWKKGHFMNNNRHHIANTYVHIGAAYRNLGQYDSALKYCMKAANLQYPEESLGFTYNEISVIYRSKGDNHLALEYLLKALDIDENVLKLPKYHPKLATAYNNIGEIYVNLGDLEKASKYLQYALEIRLKGTTSVHHDLSSTYHNLGSLYLKQKEYEKVLEMLEKALEIDTLTLHDDHESIASLHHQMAQVHLNLKNHIKAVYHGEKVLMILLRSQKKDNVELLSQFQLNLGIVQLEVGNTRKALQMAEKALKNLSESSTSNSKTIAYIYDLFSQIYQKEKYFSKALAYSQKAVNEAKTWAINNKTFELEYFLSRLEQVTKQASSTDTECLNSTTSTKVILDRLSDLKTIIKELEQRLQHVPKPHTMDLLDLLEQLIVIHSREKSYSIAKRYFDQAQTIYNEHKNSDTISKDDLECKMVTIFYHAALNYHRQQDWDMCLKMLTTSLKMASIKNEDHHILPEIYYMMASVCAHQQNVQKAIYYYELTISTGRKRFPEDHPDMQRYCFQYQLFKNVLLQAYHHGKMKT